MVCYAEKQEKPFWFSSLDQIVHFGPIIFCRTFKNYFGQFVWIEKKKKKKSHYNSRVSLHEAPTKNIDLYVRYWYLHGTTTKHLVTGVFLKWVFFFKILQLSFLPTSLHFHSALASPEPQICRCGTFWDGKYLAVQRASYLLSEIVERLNLEICLQLKGFLENFLEIFLHNNRCKPGTAKVGAMSKAQKAQSF